VGECYILNLSAKKTRDDLSLLSAKIKQAMASCLSP
jgi:hypothetical protein